ncbi:hypothetical protein K9L97_05110 [Candidatus Woesearchaeota archaeon]|nr:hypothetical protein [Candidatus Woesearchaeota archaeon]
MPEKHNFTKPSKPTQKFDNFTGDTVRGAIPQLVASNMKFGNFYDLATGRMEKYNSDENDRNLLYNNWFDLAGNPMLSLEKNDEIVIVHDLEQSDLQFVKEMISGINSNTELNNSYSFDFGGRDVYEAVKKSDGSFTVNKNIANELRNNAYSNNKARSRIMSHLFQGQKQKKNEYITVVKKHHSVSNINDILGFYPGSFTGLRLLVGGSVGGYSRVYGYDSLSSLASLLGVGDGVANNGAAGAIAQKNYSTKLQIASLDEVLQYGKLEDNFAPKQVELLNKVLETSPYKIIKQ